ncbi:MAG: hypothetical protein A7316_00265 [Candidatus Altiarchaeales archaeon WOR_SM1_86-2]|nr:MAG: hypothetical protein A7316_00265 [Candidatus Altiarchaeales archaeon WOR_SM1_86-2]ODS41731.1 MAG: hypothetical protein A7315_00415 [Candidatus Altiarchaeales archaeon WOR_SM1_79]
MGRIFAILLIIGMSISIASADDGEVCIYFFYSNECGHCIEAINNYLPGLESKYDTLKIQKFEFAYNKTNLELRNFLEKKCEQYGIYYPFIFIDGQVLDGEDINRGKVEEAVDGCISKGGCECPLKKPEIENVSIPENATLGEEVGIDAVASGDVAGLYALISKPDGKEEKIDLMKENKFLANLAGEYRIKIIAEAFLYKDIRNASVFVREPEKSMPAINAVETAPDIPTVCKCGCAEGMEVLVNATNASEVYGAVYRGNVILYNYSFDFDFSEKKYNNKKNKIIIFDPGNYTLIVAAVNENGNSTIERKFTVKLESHINPVRIHYFTTRCPECDRAAEFINELKDEYELEVIEYDVTNTTNAVILLQCAKYYNKTPKCEGADFSCWFGYTGYDAGNKVPVVILGDTFLSGSEVMSDLECLVEDCAQSGNCPAELQCAGGKICDPLPLPLVIIAGLIDGINPCAFAVLIFFISYLTAVGRDRGTIILAGGVYVAAVFAAYLAIGLVLLSIMGALHDISDIIRACIGIFALLIGIFSFYEAYVTRGGRSEETKIKMPDRLRKITNKLIRDGVRSRNMVLATAAIGFLVAAFELPCTGLIYLVVVTSMHACGILEALPYFVLYNILFILPLILIFTAVYGGTTSRRLGGFVKKNTAVMKLLTGAVLIVLALYLLKFIF